MPHGRVGPTISRSSCCAINSRSCDARTTGPHGPGRYRIEEIPQTGWKNYTPIAYEIEVGFGVRDRTYERDFGNTETVVDVAKTHIEVLDPPANLDVDTPTDIDVEVTIENLGPAEVVPVLDVLIPVVPPDCDVSPDRRQFETLLYRNQPVTRVLTFTVSCSNPSEHVFRFDDELSVTRSDIDDINPNNDEASASATIPVHAYTDIAASAGLTCRNRQSWTPQQPAPLTSPWLQPASGRSRLRPPPSC